MMNVWTLVLLMRGRLHGSTCSLVLDVMSKVHKNQKVRYESVKCNSREEKS